MSPLDKGVLALSTIVFVGFAGYIFSSVPGSFAMLGGIIKMVGVIASIIAFLTMIIVSRIRGSESWGGDPDGDGGWDGWGDGDGGD